MGKAIRKIRDLHSLEKEIIKQKIKARQLEELLDENFEYLQENHLPMLVNSVFPGKLNKESIIARIINTVIQNERLQNAVNRVVDSGIEGFKKLVNLIIR